MHAWSVATRRQFLRITGVGALAVGAGPLAACQQKDSGQDTLSKVKSAGVIKVGYSADPPWSFSTSSGELSGVAADIAAASFESMGVKLDGVLVDFGDLIPGLKAQRFDSVGDSLFITPERCGEVQFSKPFVVDNEAFAVKPGNPLGLTDFESVAKNASARLGLVRGSAESKFAKAAGVPDGQITLYDDLPTGVDAIAAGRVDAVAYDVVSMQYLVSKDPTKAQISTPFTAMLDGKPQYGASAFIFRKSDTTLLDAFNQAQSQVLSSDKARQIFQKYSLDLTAAVAEAAKLDVAELCKG